MAAVVVKAIQPIQSPFDYGQWLRGGLGGLVVRALTRNARGMWFDSHPINQIKMFKRINSVTKKIKCWSWPYDLDIWNNTHMKNELSTPKCLKSIAYTDRHTNRCNQKYYLHTYAAVTINIYILVPLYFNLPKKLILCYPIYDHGLIWSYENFLQQKAFPGQRARGLFSQNPLWKDTW